MNKCSLFLILVIFLLITRTEASETNKNDTLTPEAVQDSVQMGLDNIIQSFNINENKSDSVLKRELKQKVVLEQVILINNQLDSILNNTTKSLAKASELCFYITFMKCDNNFYFEIFEDYPNDYLFRVMKGSNKIYGHLKYKDWDFYILMYPEPCKPQDKDINSFVRKTGNRVIIEKKEQDFPFIQENPMWLYQYLDGNLVLVKSINDKGFYTNP